MVERSGAVRLRCMTHDRVFSEPVDRNFHEAINVGCRWEEVRSSGQARDMKWVALTVVIAWALLSVFLGFVLR